MQTDISNRLLVEASSYTYMFYSGLVLAFVGIFPAYSYLVTFFLIPFIFFALGIDAIALIISPGLAYYLLIAQGIMACFIPFSMVLVVFWEIILIPLFLISPLTATTGGVLLYLSLSNYS